jgi:hypothetical protein
VSETAAYLRDVGSLLRALLRSELVGVYAGGSYALGGYDPGRSDLDVAVVVRQGLSGQEKEAVAEALRHESLACPARGLELVVYLEATARAAAPDAGYELNLNSGRGMPFHLSLAPRGVDEHWFAIDRAILREHGVALVGPPPGELFAPLPRETVLRLLSDSVRWHEEHEGQADDAVLNACRAWRFATEGSWSSKAAAGEWARHRLGNPKLVAESLSARVGARPPDRYRVEAFLRQIRRRLDLSRS